MNDLQKLLKLRGQTMAQLAKKIGFSHHPVQKCIKQVRASREIRPAIARYLGREYKVVLTVDMVFGPDAGQHLRPLLEIELDKKKRAMEAELDARYLADRRTATKVRRINAKDRRSNVVDRRKQGNG